MATASWCHSHIYSWKTASPLHGKSGFLGLQELRLYSGHLPEFFCVGLGALHLTPADGDHLDTCKGKGGVGAGIPDTCLRHFSFQLGVNWCHQAASEPLTSYRKKPCLFHWFTESSDSSLDYIRRIILISVVSIYTHIASKIIKECGQTMD